MATPYTQAGALDRRGLRMDSWRQLRARRIVVNGKPGKAALAGLPAAPVAAILTAGVRRQQPVHPFRQIVIRGRQHGKVEIGSASGHTPARPSAAGHRLAAATAWRMVVPIIVEHPSAHYCH